jgi:hypothetical protein
VKKAFKFNNFTVTADQEVSIHIGQFGDLEVTETETGEMIWPTSSEVRKLGEALGGLEHGDVSKAVVKANFPLNIERLVVSKSENAIRSAGYRFNFKLKIKELGANEYSVIRVK